MKKIVKASAERDYIAADRSARKVLSAAKKLLDEIEVTPDVVFENNDLQSLYDELMFTIRTLQENIENGTVA